MSDQQEFGIVALLALILANVTHGWMSTVYSCASIVFVGLYFTCGWLDRKERKAKR